MSHCQGSFSEISFTRTGTYLMLRHCSISREASPALTYPILTYPPLRASIAPGALFPM